LRAISAAVAVKHRVVCDRYIVIDDHILYALVRILHVRPLPDIAHYPCVVSFHQELKGAYTEGVARAQAVGFLFKQAAVDSARVPAIQIQVTEDQGVVVKYYLEVVVYHTLSVYQELTHLFATRIL